MLRGLLTIRRPYTAHSSTTYQAISSGHSQTGAPSSYSTMSLSTGLM